MSNSSLTDASILLTRNLALFENQTCLLVNGPGDLLANELKQASAEIYSINTHYGFFQKEQTLASITGSHFSPLPAPDWPKFDAIVLYWPKEKPLARLLLEQLVSFLTEEGALYCVGANKGGIKSAASVLKQMGLRANKLDSARHCALYSTILPDGYRMPELGLTPYQSQIEIHCADETLQLTALPGVFSSGRLDEGTKLLLENLPAQLGNHVLDFGCGCGVISAFIAQQDGQRQVTGVDVNALAIHASEQTFVTNQLSAQAKPVAGIQDLQGMKFDAIVTNPPFHQGVSTHYDVTEQLIAQAPQLLNKGGKLVLVANRHLNYPPLLEQAFGHLEKLAKTNKFVVYQCVKS